MAVANSVTRAWRKKKCCNRKVLAELPRLVRVCESVDAVSVEVKFRFDDHRRICVEASTETLVHVACHLCSEAVAWPMQVGLQP